MSEKKHMRGRIGGGGRMGAHAMGMHGEKAKDFKGTISKLAAYLGIYKWKIIFVMVLAIVSTVFAIFSPKILGGATDELFSGIMRSIAGTGGVDFVKIGQIILTLVVLYVLSALFQYIQSYIMTGITMKVTYKLRNDIFEKIHKLPLSYFDHITHGEVQSRITNDVDTISHTLSQSLAQIITSITMIIGIAVMMFTISWQMTLAALCIIPVTLSLVMLIIKQSQKHFKNQQTYLGHVNGHVEEMLSSHTVVKSFCGEEESIKSFEEYNDTLYHSAWKANFLSGLMMPITNFVGNLGYVAICILGGYLATTGVITVGGIQSFIQYVRQFTQPISQIANISNVLQQTAAAAERVFEFLAEKEEIPEEKQALTADAYTDGTVSFERVSFGYESDKIIIKDFNAKVSHGQKIAIVGPTGAGKTTIVKLLMRFYDINEGAIKIDGNDIKLFKRDELRSIFGMVLQETWLYNGTIMENIRYGRLNAIDEEVKNAAVAAQADFFIRTLPHGYDMELNEEANNISQGQKQLLTIARAILADPEILILDEATSSVDTRTEQHIQIAMDNLMKGRTSFVIAHRLSTIKNADLILVMKDGDIVEQGNHMELISKNGFYANLYNSQFDKAI